MYKKRISVFVVYIHYVIDNKHRQTRYTVNIYRIQDLIKNCTNPSSHTKIIIDEREEIRIKLANFHERF